MKHVSHSEIFRVYRGRISVTFLILILENILLLLEPLAIGYAINALADRSWQGLLVLLILEVLIVAVGVARRFYDTRAYGGIYRTIGEDISARAIDKHEDLSPAIGRADLLQEVVDFFEHELPGGISSVFGIGGAFIMLIVLAPMTGFVSLISVLGIALVFFVSRKRIRGLNAQLNDELEARAGIFLGRQRKPLAQHFAQIVRHRIALSDLEARNFGLSYLFVILLIAFALYDSVAVQQAPIGDVFAIVTYASQFAESLLMLPFLYQQYIRTSEITGRIRGDSAIEDGSQG